MAEVVKANIDALKRITETMETLGINSAYINLSTYCSPFEEIARNPSIAIFCKEDYDKLIKALTPKTITRITRTENGTEESLFEIDGMFFYGYGTDR